jgi:hypothetical protein
MQIWDDKERFNKLLRSVQKWLEFQSSDDLAIDEEVVKQAYKKTQEHSYEIIEKFDIKDDGTAGFLQSWVELCMFAGYLVGWKDSGKLIEDNPAPAGGQPILRSGDFYITTYIDEQAKKYALEASSEIFNRMFSEPLSPLVLGLEDRFVRLIKVIHESSLYAGFLSGVEDAFLAKTARFDPFSLKMQ